MADIVKKTGMIGLGAMGYQMARHMVNKGFDVAGYEVHEPGEDEGASRVMENVECPSPAQRCGVHELQTCGRILLP